VLNQPLLLKNKQKIDKKLFHKTCG